jgi:hypothetical protein
MRLTDLKIDVDPETLNEEQRNNANFVANELFDGLRFPNNGDWDICPPIYEGFMCPPI